MWCRHQYKSIIPLSLGYSHLATRFNILDLQVLGHSGISLECWKEIINQKSQQGLLFDLLQMYFLRIKYGGSLNFKEITIGA
jgi:hypothetical protein